MHISTLKEAHAIAGSIGKPSKMPCNSYGLPAKNASFVPSVCLDKGWDIPPSYGCSVGKLLGRVKGTTCYNCYASERGNYTYPDVHIGQTKRLVGVYDRPRWKYAMLKLIQHYADKEDKQYFRWLDSGDLVDKQMLLDIIWIAEQLPDINFWLPTQERKILHQVFSFDKIVKPDNLSIRVYNVWVDIHIPYNRFDFIGSTSVSTEGKHTCKSDQFDNTCGDCRDCWDTSINHVIYKEH